MNFNDDEPLVAIPDVLAEAEEGDSTRVGNTKTIMINKTEAPLEESEFKVMLVVTGADIGEDGDREGVDLVTVLDVSGSMGEKEDGSIGDQSKLDRLKTAMKFIIRKLSVIDRLSIVTFNNGAHKVCPLRQMTETSQAEIEDQVNALEARGGTNIAAGLEMALKVLDGRNLKTARVGRIMLMSDGKPSRNAPDAAKVDLCNVPVYTFGFGANQDPFALKAITDNSQGGTFSSVQARESLTIAFSQCLAGLLSLVVDDLKLTITPVKSKIVKVSAGSYIQSRDNAAGSVTVSFGDLYAKERRKVIVNLLLPFVSGTKEVTYDVLSATSTYKTGQTRFVGTPILATVTRTRTSVEPEREELIIEEKRIQAAEAIKEVRKLMAKDNQLQHAKDELVRAQKSLDQDVAIKSNPFIEMLKSELQQFLMLLDTEDIYKKQGLAFGLASETSHDRQRSAARGDVEKLNLFSTPLMEKFLEQAKLYDENPSKPPPTLDEDVKQLAAEKPPAPVEDPIAPVVVGALAYYTQMAIQFVKWIADILRRIR